MDNNPKELENQNNSYKSTLTKIIDFSKSRMREINFTSKFFVLAIACALLSIILLLVHKPAILSQASSFDDFLYVYQNNLVKNPSWLSVKRFFSEVLNPSTVGGYYQPLAMVSLMIDCFLGASSDNMSIFHITSLCLHILNSSLVLLLFYLLFNKVWLAFVGGVLFGIHPIATEEIAWLSERKSVLATLFILLSLVLYILYVRSTKKRYLVISILTFILALLSKPIAVSLPFIILLFDYFWFKRLSFICLVEKIPYFVVAGIFSVIAYISQKNTASLSIMTQNSSILQLFLLICYNNIFYLWKLLIPTNLSPYYAFVEPISLSNPAYLISAILTILIIVFFIITWRKSKTLLLGYLFYIISILPTSGIIKVSHTITWYKYAYFPSIGIFLCLIIVINNITKHRQHHILKYIIALTLVFSIFIGEVAASINYSSNWKDSETLNTHMLKINPNSTVILDLVAGTYLAQGKTEKAIELLNKSININPNSASTYLSFGAAYSKKEQTDKAISMYNKAIELGLSDIERASAYYSLGLIYKANANNDQSIKMFKKSIELNPEYLSASFELGIALNDVGKFDEAVALYEKIIQDYPNTSLAYTYLGILYAGRQEFNKAITLISKSIDLNPYNAFAYYTLGNVLVNYDKPNEANLCYDQALSLDPNNTSIYIDYARFFAQYSKFEDSIRLLRKSIAISETSEAYIVLGDVFRDLGKNDEAIESYGKALKIAPNNSYVQEAMNKLKEEKYNNN